MCQMYNGCKNVGDSIDIHPVNCIPNEVTLSFHYKYQLFDYRNPDQLHPKCQMYNGSKSVSYLTAVHPTDCIPYIGHIIV